MMAHFLEHSTCYTPVQAKLVRNLLFCDGQNGSQGTDWGTSIFICHKSYQRTFLCSEKILKVCYCQVIGRHDCITAGTVHKEGSLLL